jgi:hypothetical protein
MLSRRDILAGGLAGGLAGEAEARSEEQQPDRDAQREIARAVQDVERTLDRSLNAVSLSVGVVAALRKTFETFLKANAKFPDFCDVGLGVFYEVYDWHVRHRQQIVVSRQVDNRYIIQFMFTALVLRHDYDTNYIGYPYDKP